MIPEVVSSIEGERSKGKFSFLLTWNTNDRQLYMEEKIYPCNLHFMLASHLALQGFHVGLYSQGAGVRAFDPPNSKAEGKNPFPNDAQGTLMGLTGLLQASGQKKALIIQYGDLLAPSSEGNVLLERDQQSVLETLHRWGFDDSIRQSGNLIILISYEGAVHGLLTRSGAFTTIEVPLPGLEVRREMAELLTTRTGRSSTYGRLAEGYTMEEFARGSNGLRLNDIEGLFRAKVGSTVTRQDVQAIKSVAIQDMAGGLMEIVEPTEGFESVAGLDAAKAYFQQIQWMFQHGSPAVPYGILLAGVPGVGKSKLCSALAKELDLPLLIMRNLYGPYVGQSEANLERVLHVVDAMSPCVVVIEEIDQGIGQRGSGPSGDSGTSNRMSQRLWEALGSGKNRGRNLWIGTSNRPDLLDAALLDRFQVVVPFLHPTPREVVELLPVLAKQVQRVIAPKANLAAIADLPNLELPTVRALCEIVSQAAQRADYESGEVGQPLEHRHLEAAAEDFKRTYDPLQHELIALRCISMVLFNSLLPWMDKGTRRKDTPIPSYLDNIVDPSTGFVNDLKLMDRIRDLEDRLLHQRMRR